MLKALEHEQRRSSLERSKHGRIDDGKIPQVEDTTPLHDADDVSVSVESSGMVHDSARPDNTTVSTGKCSHGGNDRCICGVART